MPSINPGIFKAYDIRGIYPSELNEQTALAVGRSFAHLIITENPNRQLSVAISSDMRLSSPQLKKSIIEGIIQSGINVVDIGLCSTPTLYFATGYYSLDGGIQVSASHNPAEYNGMKMVRAKAVPISGDTGIMTIRDTAIASNFTNSQHPGKVISQTGVIADLIRVQTSHVDKTKIKPFKIVIDAANAMGSLDCQALFDTLPCQVVPLNFELDGTFPVHEADPSKPENLKQLSEKVISEKADFGIAIDGDADRYFIVMNNGQLLKPEILRGILAQIVLKSNPGANIGYDIRPGKITQDMILEAGGKPFITRVGHSLIKEAMIKAGSPFSGESSGHFFYRSDYGSFEMPVHMLVDFLTWLSAYEEPLDQIIQPLDRYFHSGEINATVKDALAVFTQLKINYADAKKFSDLDGVYFEYPDYWFNVRASNTEPKVRLNLEARTRSLMETKRDEVLSLINNHGISHG